MNATDLKRMQQWTDEVIMLYGLDKIWEERHETKRRIREEAMKVDRRAKKKMAVLLKELKNWNHA